MKALVLVLVLGLVVAGCGFDANLLVEERGPDGGSGRPVTEPERDAAARPRSDSGTSAAHGFDLGENETCALVSGVPYCFGTLATEGTPSDYQTSPTVVTLAEPVVDVCAGVLHACALGADGKVRCWGKNPVAQLASPDPAATGPVVASLPGRAVSLACGTQHSCAILADGTLWCWGGNAEGQLGQSDLPLGPSVASPTQVGVARDYVAAGLGDGHSCAIRKPGTLWCWGRNTEAHLGLGGVVPDQIRTPTRVGTFTDWTAVTSAQEGSCGLRAEGSLWCWGGNAGGRVGAGGDVVLDPTRVTPSTDFVTVDTGTFHTCATKRDGSLYCWGRNVEGQLGVGSAFETALEPARVPGTASWRDVRVGRFHTCGMQSNGELYCAGKNDVGQLGLGDTTRRADLTRVTVGP
ncbi:MAG TPA: hypothetical protein VF395_21880 [Polyangiaceae bacterium]